MKVFRLYSQGSNGIDWFSVNQYGDAVINNIKDPQGVNSKIEITSIPSPFARIDLVKSAFEYVVRDATNNRYDTGGTSIYHKLVADTLDVAELMFNYEQFKDKIDIIPWDPDKDIEELLNSEADEHKLLGKTLKTYWDQDKEAYNFESVNRLYIFKYNHIIFGGTSPTTLFFSAPDISSNLNIRLGNNLLFDNVFDPLYRRDPDFIFYLKVMFEKTAPELKRLMPDFYNYIEINLSYLQIHDINLFRTLNDKLNQLSDFSSLKASYSLIDTGTHGDNVEILGIEYHAKKIKNPSDSAFVIKSTKYEGVLPLALQNGFNIPLEYANGTIWNQNFVVPDIDTLPLSERTLPNLNIKYPYLTIGDFFETQLIRLPYKLNSDDYFDGNLVNAEEDTSFLLPLKKEFFDFFDPEYLKTKDNNGNKVFEIKRHPGGNITVYLRIPIASGDFIEFKKQYIENELPNHLYVQVECPVSIGIMPFIKVPVVNNVNINQYIVQCIDNDTDSSSYDLDIFNSNNILVDSNGKTRTQKREGGGVETKYFSVSDTISFIQVKNNNIKGVLIPLFHDVNYPGVDAMSFAIDFGTTNTHIEYKKDRDEPHSFEITQNEYFYRSTMDMDAISPRYKVHSQYSRQELLPREISNEESGYTFFPIRTALNQNTRVNFGTTVRAFIDANIAFFYELETQSRFDKVYTNLKWSNYMGGVINPDKIRIEKFIESLLILIRTKVLQNNGDLNKVTIKWLYPSSMLLGRRESLKNLWNELVLKWISNDAKIINYSESIAPFFFFNKHDGVTAAAFPVVSIDIGGGTTDVVVYENNKPSFTTSFRYAANSLFGDGYGGSSEMNGFVKKYKNEFSALFANNDLNGSFDFDGILEEISANNSSYEIMSFFFSLENNKSLDNDFRNRVDFDKILNQDDDFKIVFVTFYVSLIYHIATLMKTNGTSMPRYLTFSGNGSKILYILGGNHSNFEYITELTQIIFNKIYDVQVPNYKLEIKLPKEPKIITCKGCLEDKSNSFPNIEDININLINSKIITKSSEYNYQDIIDSGDTFAINAIREYKEFIRFLFELNTDLSFQNYFNIPAIRLEQYKSILLSDADIPNFLQDGLNRKIDELGDDLTQRIEETTFFYILNGMLYNLAKDIYNEN